MSTLVVEAGQSNALVFNLTAADLPTGAYTPTDLVQIWVPDPDKNPSHGQFEEMLPGVNTGIKAQPASWGPEVQFATDWLQDHPGETLYIVKSADGGIGLAQDPTQADWSPSSTGELFDITTAKVAAAEAALATAGVTVGDTAVLWVQGEQDATDPAKAAAYGANEADLFAAIRAQWLEPSTPIFFARLSAGQTGLAYRDEVTSAQDSVDQADGNAADVNTDDFPLQADSLHYAGAGTLDLGGALYQAYQTAPRSFTGSLADDTISGAAGSDLLSGGDGNDVVGGAAGDDTVQGNKGDDTVQGNAGADVVLGGQGNDVLHGGQGDDQVFGNLGNDWLSGDLGNDTLTGGPGADTFHFYAGGGADVVTDFNGSEGDRVQLDLGSTYALSQTGNDVVVDLGGGSLLTLQNVQLSSLPAGWLFEA